MFGFVRNYQTIFQGGSTVCIPTSSEWKFTPAISIMQFILSSFLNLTILVMWVVVFHCCFNLHFANDKGYWVSQMLICHQCIFFAEVSIQIFVHFLNVSLIIIYWWVLRVLFYILDTSPLQICVLQIFFPLACGLFFDSPNSVFNRTESFDFDKS